MISNVNGKKIIQYLKIIEFSHTKLEKKNKKKILYEILFLKCINL